MGILDQIFGTQSNRQVINLGPAEWVAVGTSISAHQAMQDGMRPVPSPSEVLSRPDFDNPGIIDVSKSLNMSYDYRKLLFRDQIQDVRRTSTADFVVESGIKQGSKVLISVVPESEGNTSSWDEIVKARISGSPGTPMGLVFPYFSVASITEPNEARYQIHETLGADIIQSFGTRPRILMLSGYVVNGKVSVSIFGENRSMDWKNAFQRFYKNRFSLDKCIRNKEKIRIFAQDTIWDGYLLNMIVNTTAESQSLSQVTISFVLKKETFASENDDAIPGMLQDSGFTLTAKGTPSEFFPQAVLEEFLRNDLSVGIEDELDWRYDDLERMARNIIKITGDSSVDSMTHDIRKYKQRFYVPADGFALHETLRDTIIASDIKRLFEEISENDAAIFKHNLFYFNMHQEELVFASSLDEGNEELFADQEFFLQRTANIRNKKKNLKNKVLKLNRLAEEAKSLDLYIQELEKNL